jgi:hypothetical protein
MLQFQSAYLMIFALMFVILAGNHALVRQGLFCYLVADHALKAHLVCVESL